MHRWLFLLGAIPVVAACSTDDGLFGEASSASSGTASTEGAGASPSSSSGGAEGPGAAGPGGGGPGPGPGPSSSSGPGGGPSTGGASDGGGGGAGDGGGPPDAIGCSDGEREYFTDLASQPLIAGCDAGFDEPGVTTPNSFMPTCGRHSGDDSANPEGTDCSVEDACSKGWHVCLDAAEVASHSATGGCEPSVIELPRFYLTRQVQDDQFPAQCAGAPFVNNIVGCGTLGDLTGPSCSPLDRRMRVQECVPTANWYCGNDNNDASMEAAIVFKVGSGEGGILCCKD